MDTALAPLTPTTSKILHTAARLFMQRGYRAVSINDIIQEAGITKPTLYYHFRDKEELFAQMAIQRLITLHSALDTALHGKQSLHSRLAAQAHVLLNANDGDMRMLRHEMKEHLSLAQQQRLGHAFQQHLFLPVQQVMQQGLAQGELRTHSDSELTILFLGLMESFHGFEKQITLENLPDHARQLQSTTIFSAEALVNLFLYGINADPPTEVR